MKVSSDQLAAVISAVTGHPFKTDSMTPLSSASPWQAVRIDNARTGTPKHVFAKIGDTEHLAVFKAEKDGLDRLRGANTALRVPAVIACQEQALGLLAA